MRSRGLLRGTRLLFVFLLLASFIASAQERSGESIYKQDCIKCHGAVGEGTKKAPQPLVGEKSPAQLAGVINKTMPDDDPGTCTGEDAKKVAAYLHDAFYSPDARARLNPPRVELSRLTVRQFRNSVADIIGSFSKAPSVDKRHGLHGEYFDGRGFDGRGTRFSKALIDRIDPEVRFDFGTAGPPMPQLGPVAAPAPKAILVGPPKLEAAILRLRAPIVAKAEPAQTTPGAPSTLKPGVFGPPPPPTAAAGQEQKPEQKPDAKKFNDKQFCISWEGSIFAPEAGSYEFMLRSEHGVQLWVNDLNNKRPLIDAQVRSGGDAQQLRGTIPLLAGRWYSIRLEFYKGKELDKKKMDDPKTVSKKASIALLWKMPHGEMETIPASYLSPARSVEVMLAETPFPPDDRSYGWERGTTISKEWNAATTDAALEAAAFVTTRLAALSGAAADAPDRTAKVRAFARAFAERAFRRPLTEPEQKQFVDRQFDATPDLELAVKRVVLLILKSPRFLYPGVMDSSDEAESKFKAYATASRLSYALWDSSPDQTLLDAAAANKLSTREELVAQAERMLATPRAQAKVREFLLAWLRVDRLAELTKDAKRFPGFDAAITSDLRESLELFLDDVVWSEKSDFRQLLLSDDTFLNARLAKFYGADAPGGSNAIFKRTKWESDKRAGVLTHPYMLAGLAYPAESSPIHRGVFVVRGMLGMTLHPPPDAVVPLPPELHPNMTTRDRVTMQTKPAACIQCHGLINPLGFPLENFDAVGRFRQLENGKDIDVGGLYETRSGEIAKFTGAKQLAAMLAGNEQVHAAFVQQLFQHILKQPVRAYGLTKPQELLQSFAKSGYNVRKLVAEIAVIAAQGTK